MLTEARRQKEIVITNYDEFLRRVSEEIGDVDMPDEIRERERTMVFLEHFGSALKMTMERRCE